MRLTTPPNHNRVKTAIANAIQQDPIIVLTLISSACTCCKPCWSTVVRFKRPSRLLVWTNELSKIGMSVQGNIVNVSMSSLLREASKIYSKFNMGR